jgi:hypothetical protein
LGGVVGLGLGLVTPVMAEDYTCPGGRVTIQGALDRAPAICDAAARATQELASCNLEVPPGVTIEVTRSIPGECYGLYHCSEDLIQLLPLDAYETYLTGNPDSPFGHISPQVFFDSVLRHELAHAALHEMPCPYVACPATQEFVAYSMQIRFLPEADRAPFDARAATSERPTTSDNVNVMALMMAPEHFIEHAYRYLSEQDDPCGLIGSVARGDVNFDMPFR